MRLVLLVLLIASAANNVLSARILAVMPIAAKSHHYITQAVLKTLAARGHQVVNYSPFTLPSPVPNYTDVHIDCFDFHENTIPLDTLLNMSPVGGAKLIWANGLNMLLKPFADENLKKLIQSNEKFDLVFSEVTFAQEALLAFGHKFKAPVINVHTFGSFGLLNRISGNSLSLTSVPDFTFPFSNHMTFYERLLNVYSVVSSLHYYYREHLPSQEALMRSVFKDPSMPPLVDMLHNISLFLNNINSYVYYSQPYTPNIVPIGGIHLSQERKPLPQAIKTFLDEGKEGVIYLSLGTFIPEKILPQKYFDNFINAFLRLPYKVVWKTEMDLTDLGGKIFTSKWMPQQGILAHPNVVLFITHGGLLSQHEAISAGVPVVCIPFLADQPMNAKFYEDREIGVRIKYHDLSEDSIYAAVTQALTTKFKDNMAKLSRIYRDQPTSPADRVVFWVEYVLRHGGANHLRPASTWLPWYKLYLVDVVAVLLVVALTCLFVTYLIIRKLYRVIFGRRFVDKVTSGKKSN